MRNFKTEGIIIKRFNTSEADRVLTVFTRNLGKCKIRAKGVRRVPSRRSAHVELLNHSTLTLYQNKSRAAYLVEANTLNSFQEIKDDLTKVGFSYHLCELIDGLCPENQELASIYDLFLGTINKLCNCKTEEVSELVHEFEVSLLVALGFWRRDERVLTSLDTTQILESVLERRLRSRRIFSKIDR